MVQSENPRARSETGGTVPPAASGRPRLRPWAVSTPWALEEAGQAEGMLLWPSRADAILSRLACGHPHFGTKAVGAPGSRPAPHAAPLSSVGGAGLGGRPAPSSTRQDMSISRHACVGREWAKRHTWDRKSCAEPELVVGDCDLRPVPIWPNRRRPGDDALGVVARCLHSSPAAIEELIDGMRVVS